MSPTAGEILAADTPRTTVDGNNFVAPAGWSIKTAGSAVVLTAPEGGSHIALVDVGAAKDADAAVAAAWAAYDPKAKWPLKLAGDRPVRDGWEQIRGYQYETSANDQRGVSAGARRRGNRWTVSIYDMANAVSDKRDAQIELIGRLLPKGYSRETFAGKAAHKLDAARIDALKQFVEDARQQFDVPGVAIGLVQDGNVVLAEGFGVRELGKPDKVDANTLFMVASNTKALTTLMLAKLVEAGKFTWDTPATQVLPTFKLGDADTTRQVLMKHLVCACTGLPRQDMEGIFEGERLTPASVMATLATMQPTSRFGELYQYSNPLASAAGFVGGHALHPQLELGAAYDAAMQTLVFDPLAMTSTTFDFARAQRGNHAAPHSEDVDGKTVPASMDLNYVDIPYRPNGGVWSNVNDMLRYVQMELDKGLLPDGKRYIAEAPLLARRVQQVATGNDTGYGMGLKIDRSMGTPLMQHGGVAYGFISNMLWLPEHNVGAVILTNADAGGSAIRYLFRRRWLEVLFDGNSEAIPNMPLEAKRMKESLAAKRKRLTVPADPAAIGKLAARYRSAELGDIAVSQKGETTWFDFGGWKSEVATLRDDDGTVTLVTIAPSGFEFIVADKDNERSLVLRDEQHEYVFVEAK
ncbi:serine hydrolase domain-containing protein [Lysobacter sp. CFH 32150]|uniref:serine hydrolase domain-containing protein n=1 Tax=Lysobacter sp. CFH 32150 TaxID=2927128 RepID=UPI001FA7BEE5|nr:serine hydrolase domain-containing protein [Lysobacter sp. CFH 32150]MCI4566663.1 beta-lactamase family protein [Lysobacter sp. CFH 32150]